MVLLAKTLKALKETKTWFWVRFSVTTAAIGRILWEQGTAQQHTRVGKLVPSVLAMERTTELSSAEEGVSKVLERGRLLQEEASSLTTRWTREADVLGQQAVALLSDITSLKADINNASEKDDITQPVAQKVGVACEVLTVS